MSESRQRLARVVIHEEGGQPFAIRDLETFRAWGRAQDHPRGRYAFLDGALWIDNTREDIFTHNEVRCAIDSVLFPMERERERGRYLVAGGMWSNLDANLATMSDGCFVTFDALRSGRVKHLPNHRGVGFVETVGTPEMVLEVVSDASVEKDTVLLPRLYHAAGVPESWLVDVRTEDRFEIRRRTEAGYQLAVLPDGWWRSEVFGHDFRLLRDTDPMGYPRFTLEHR